MWNWDVDRFQVRAFPGRQGISRGRLLCERALHAAGKRDSRCGNAQPSRQRCHASSEGFLDQGIGRRFHKGGVIAGQELAFDVEHDDTERQRLRPVACVP
jgi:hypothetical protein